MMPTDATYEQSTGKMLVGGVVIGLGYSGRGDGKNNPAMQEVRDVGPIPCGLWRAVELIEQHPDLGPYVIRLEPCDGTETFGRSGFFVHGDSLSDPGNGSHGCIVQPHPTRQELWLGSSRFVNVVPGEAS